MLCSIEYVFDTFQHTTISSDHIKSILQSYLEKRVKNSIAHIQVQNFIQEDVNGIVRADLIVRTKHAKQRDNLLLKADRFEKEKAIISVRRIYLQALQPEEERKIWAKMPANIRNMSIQRASKVPFKRNRKRTKLSAREKRHWRRIKSLK